MTDSDKAETAKRRAQGRSPSYPSISVKEALAKVQALRGQEGDYAAPLTSAFTAWGYGEKSSGGRQTLATLRYFGLIDVTGEGDSRKIKVSDIARRILLDQREDDTEKRQLIRQVALMPAAHKALYDEYPNGLGSDGSVQHFLIFNQEFNPDAARELLAEYKETAEYARLYQPSNEVDKTTEIDKNATRPVVVVGSKIQWLSAGVEQFQVPATVLGISDDGNWVFTDKGKSGIPITEVSIVEQPADDKIKAPEIPPHLLLKALKGDFGPSDELAKGQEILMSGKLKSGSFEVRVTGEVTAADIRRIRKMLEAQEAILGDDEDIDPNEI